jgi:hypothetical protein
MRNGDNRPNDATSERRCLVATEIDRQGRGRIKQASHFDSF